MKCDGSSGGIGGVIRNSKGDLIAFFSESISSSPSILAELLTMKFGLILYESRPECAVRSSIFRWIPRNINFEADTIAKVGMNNCGDRG
ncbi:hypothetical protein V6N13_062917 [Hibiscus sabdariffa]|uniref:Uncharacterized protein n=2 Tax=Hibiscus sabdariffa TaxID=183260 RepID=A0ABR2C3K8_9ROSI